MLIRVANVAGMAAALALAMASTLASAPPPTDAGAGGAAPAPGVRIAALPDGSRALLDAGGYPVPLRDYRRIVAGSTVADELLLALCEPSRIAGFTVYSAEHGYARYRFAGRPAHGGLGQVEQILALKPDLVVTNHIGDPQGIARLRERGVAVFDMGPMRGMDYLPANIHQLAHLLGDPERGARYAAALERRLRAVARGVPPEQRKRALYVSAYGDKLYGGTRGTSYHDVLTAAGLIDVAAERYRDWPAYTAEELLAMDPELLVTGSGMRVALCSHPGLAGLRACAAAGGIVELEQGLTQNAGPIMLDAAEQLFARAYGTQANAAGRAP